MASKFQALVDYEDAYVQPLIIEAFKKCLPASSYSLIDSTSDDKPENGPLLQFRAYEAIEFERALEDQKSLINAYIIRKALIRKHYLSNTLRTWTTKYPDSTLKKHFKPSVEFEVDYSEFLDDALLEAYELKESFAKNEGLEPSEREWWILKPSMTDRGQGIRLFSTEEELQSIFEEWDPPESDDEEGDDEAKTSGDEQVSEVKSTSGFMSKVDDNLTTAHLRDFIAQPYIHPPLLLQDQGEQRKFHIRVYVLAVGALKVYVYKPMLALFAEHAYKAPWEDPDRTSFLTNTCIQETGEREGAVRAFWDLPSSLPNLPETWKENVYSQILTATGELFKAAAKNNAVHFQPLPNAFELFGLDFLVDDKGTAFLLEVNAFPDFKQTGDELKDLVQGLFEEVVDVAIRPFFGIEESSRRGTGRMHEVLDVDMGRR